MSVSSDTGSPATARGPLGDLLDQLVGDPLVHEEPGAGDARPPGCGEDPRDDAVEDVVHADVVEEDVGALAASFDTEGLEVLGGPGRDEAGAVRTPGGHTLRTSGCATSASPASWPYPVTTLRQPSGRPACGPARRAGGATARSPPAARPPCCRRRGRGQAHAPQQHRRVERRDDADDAVGDALANTARLARSCGIVRPSAWYASEA